MLNLLDLIFPKRCVGCGRVGNFLCPKCILEIKQTDLVCPFCKRLSLGGIVHPVCKRRYGLSGLWSLGVYQDSLKKAIQKIKYRWIKELAEILIDITIDYWARNQPLLFEQIKKNKGEDWLIVPVPLHKLRQNWRGFNQSALLAKLLATKIGLNHQEALIRVKNTKPQVGLKSHQRKQNIKGVFALSMNHKPPTNILLIDDVWTTGSTLKECCFVLKKAGAKQVWALTLAR